MVTKYFCNICDKELKTDDFILIKESSREGYMRLPPFREFECCSQECAIEAIKKINIKNGYFEVY